MLQQQDTKRSEQRLKHLKLMLCELEEDSLKALGEAEWPLQLLQMTAQSPDAVKYAVLKMLGPLAIHINIQPLRLL